MAFANEQQYEDMISALQTFRSAAQEKCQTLSSAGNDCVDNTENDPAATKANASIQKCVGEISSALEDVERIEQALAEELEEIRAAAAKADNLGD